MRGGNKLPKTFTSKCLVHDCDLPMQAKNLCNKHYLREYFKNQPTNDYSRGMKWVRRNTLAYEMSEVTQLPFKTCRKILRIILNKITEALRQGEEVSIPGFGIFGLSKIKKGQVYFLPSRELQGMMK